MTIDDQMIMTTQPYDFDSESELILVRGKDHERDVRTQHTAICRGNHVQVWPGEVEQPRGHMETPDAGQMASKYNIGQPHLAFGSIQHLLGVDAEKDGLGPFILAGHRRLLSRHDPQRDIRPGHAHPCFRPMQGIAMGGRQASHHGRRVRVLATFSHKTRHAR